MDWSQLEDLEQIDVYEKSPKRVKFDTSEDKTTSEFENKLNELLKIKERINIIINELHILYTYKL